ncbi:MAG: carboxylating nicotinate-nucleotide diphosphorylase [Spirochaetales bacterium]|nr:carboxylating nicotinate-nucleotide diphosphorylase [Spirochaetales bacterium]
MSSLIKLTLEEDLADVGDVTSKAIFTDETDIFHLISKNTGVLCGTDTVVEVFNEVDPGISVKFLKNDSEELVPGTIIAEISGTVRSILTAERTALNFLSHLSGIATKTRDFTRLAKGAVILDTRKTIPGLRRLEKYAVVCGGGQNHRMGLYDMVMIKDNHIDAAGGIPQAVQRIRDMWGSTYRIEVETRNLEEVRTALECGADRIMLDNMSSGMMKEAVAIVGGAAETEASGNVNLERIADIAKTGVDFISVGGLTHTVTAFDFSLRKM